MADKYRIGEVAKLLGVTTSAIRFMKKWEWSPEKTWKTAIVIAEKDVKSCGAFCAIAVWR